MSDQMGRLAQGLLANPLVYDSSGKLDPFGAAVDRGPEEIAFVMQGDIYDGSPVGGPGAWRLGLYEAEPAFSFR